MKDLHTHRNLGTNVIRNIYPSQAENFLQNHPKQPYSIGIHPWHINPDTLPEELTLLQKYAALPQATHIGETGLDYHCTTPRPLQREIFQTHALLAEQLQKPLIIHCVKAWNDILKLHHQWQPTQPWIIHGFRGNPTLAQQLLAEGLQLSLGWHFNPDTLRYLKTHNIPFHIETDDTPHTIEDIATKINNTL